RRSNREELTRRRLRPVGAAVASRRLTAAGAGSAASARASGASGAGAEEAVGDGAASGCGGGDGAGADAAAGADAVAGAVLSGVSAAPPKSPSNPFGAAGSGSAARGAVLDPAPLRGGVDDVAPVGLALAAGLDDDGGVLTLLIDRGAGRSARRFFVSGSSIERPSSSTCAASAARSSSSSCAGS